MIWQAWLDNFVSAWQAKDTDAVLALFTDDVEYWETPFKKLIGKAAVAKEWEIIKTHTINRVRSSIVMEAGNSCVADWRYDYVSEGQEQTWSGLYVIEFNPDRLSKRFYQVGEQKL